MTFWIRGSSPLELYIDVNPPELGPKYLAKDSKILENIPENLMNTDRIYHKTIRECIQTIKKYYKNPIIIELVYPRL